MSKPRRRRTDAERINDDRAAYDARIAHHEAAAEKARGDKAAYQQEVRAMLDRMSAAIAKETP